MLNQWLHEARYFTFWLHRNLLSFDLSTNWGSYQNLTFWIELQISISGDVTFTSSPLLYLHLLLQPSCSQLSMSSIYRELLSAKELLQDGKRKHILLILFDILITLKNGFSVFSCKKQVTYAVSAVSLTHPNWTIIEQLKLCNAQWPQSTEQEDAALPILNCFLDTRLNS